MIVVDEIKVDGMDAKKGYLSLIEIMELFDEPKAVLVHRDYQKEEHDTYLCSGIRLTTDKEEIPNGMVIELVDESFDIVVDIDLLDLFYGVFIEAEDEDICIIDLTDNFGVTLEIHM